MKIICYIFLLIWSIQSVAQSNQSTASRFVVKNPETLFIGAVMKASGINEEVHQLVDVVYKPIVVSYSIPIKSGEYVPSHSNMMNDIRNKLKSDDLLKQSQEFSFSVTELKSKSDLSFSFGQYVNLAPYFGILPNQRIKKTMVLVDISQSFFSVVMDLQESITDDPKVMEQVKDFIYVSSIQFGRRAMAVIESDAAVEEVKVAINDMLKEGMPIAEKSKAVLARATIRCVAIGNGSVEQTDPDNPLSGILGYMRKKVTVDDFGVPISFTASCLEDHSMFYNTFSAK